MLLDLRYPGSHLLGADAGLALDALLAEANLAPGDVVYSGSGLIGYGELIIVKHDERWLSAYGHNRRRRVSEGDSVTAGQHIADMGRNDHNEQVLHFEIRSNGRPVNPLDHRMRMLAALECVDWVLPFEEDTPERLICEVLPDILVKGWDNDPDKIPGGDCVRQNGGEVRVLSYVAGVSTTEIIGTIRGQS